MSGHAFLSTLPTELVLEIAKYLNADGLVRLTSTSIRLYSVITKNAPHFAQLIQQRERSRLSTSLEEQDFRGLSLTEALRRYVRVPASTKSLREINRERHFAHEFVVALSTANKASYPTNTMNMHFQLYTLVMILCALNERLTGVKRGQGWVDKKLPDAMLQVVDAATDTSTPRCAHRSVDVQSPCDRALHVLGCNTYCASLPRHELQAAFESILAAPMAWAKAKGRLQSVNRELALELGMTCTFAQPVWGQITPRFGYRSDRAERIVDAWEAERRMSEIRKAAMLEDVEISWT